MILAIDDTDVRKIDDLITYLLKEKSVGDKTIFTVLRDGKTMTIDLILGERPE